MMIIIISLGIGIILGFFAPVTIAPEYSQFAGSAILAAVDAVLGAINARLKGSFKAEVMVSGFFGNAAIAAGLAFLGQCLGIDLYIAAVVLFGTRIFQNFAEMRRILLTLTCKKDTIGEG